MSRPGSLSVAVASFRSPGLLDACLASLARARAEAGTDVRVHVARPSDAQDASSLFEDRPWATLVLTDPGADVPRLRGAAMASAGEGWVAVTEDHCVVSEGWLARLRKWTAGEIQVVGGGMGNARPGPLNWGAFFSEYGFFSANRAESEGFSLVTGANVMYGPEVAGEVAGWAGAGAWEDVVHARLAERGVRFAFAPSATVSQNAEYRFWSFCRDRYEHGHAYARDRLAEDPGTSRAMRVATTPLLPLLLTARVARAAARGNPGSFALALPFTLAFLAAWSVGEAAGYLKGRRI